MKGFLQLGFLEVVLIFFLFVQPLLLYYQEKMSAPVAAAHRLQVQSLYKRSLKLSLDWYIQRDLWRQKALQIRAQFEHNKNVTNPKEIQALVQKAEKELEDWAHPDPYKCNLILIHILETVY
jgi:NADH dehydrogenase (ubiquinone) 1 beta subcomplex subunit 9